MKYLIYFYIVFNILIQARTGHNGLKTFNLGKQAFLPDTVQLGKHIIQQQYGFFVGNIFQNPDFRQLQRKGRAADLSLGTVTPAVITVYFKGKIIPVGPRVGCGGVNIPLTVFL